MSKKDLKPLELSILDEIDNFSFFHFKSLRIRKLCEKFEYLLDHTEEIPVLLLGKNCKHELDYKAILKAGEKILEKSHLLDHKELKNRLLPKFIGLQYRIEKGNGGLDPSLPDEADCVRLIERAREWKKREASFSDTSLSQTDEKKIREACSYKKFAELLFLDSGLMERFFQWALRDGNSTRFFIEYPRFSALLCDCHLNGRIGRMGGDMLKIQIEKLSENCSRKIITLKIEGRDENLLDANRKITFRGNYSLTMKEIFRIFKNKTYKVGNLELLKSGIENWNVHQLGWWNAPEQKYEQINMAKRNWWEQLPYFELISLDQANERYGRIADGKTWIAAATASRGSKTLDFDQTHAYLEIAIPKNENEYAIYDFGKFAFVFPSSFFENLTFFCHNVHATVAFPDENVFYTHRQHAQHAFPLKPSQGLALMDSIREDILKSRAGNMVFQIESDNCAKWSYEKLEAALGKGKLPNLFRMSLLDTEPVGFVAFAFKLINKLPKKLRVPVLTALHLPFGAAEGTWIRESGKLVYKSLTNHAFWRTAEVYLPAYLHKQKEMGLLN